MSLGIIFYFPILFISSLQIKHQITFFYFTHDRSFPFKHSCTQHASMCDTRLYMLEYIFRHIIIHAFNGNVNRKTVGHTHNSIISRSYKLNDLQGNTYTQLRVKLGCRINLTSVSNINLIRSYQMYKFWGDNGKYNLTLEVSFKRICRDYRIEYKL